MPSLMVQPFTDSPDTEYNEHLQRSLTLLFTASSLPATADTGHHCWHGPPLQPTCHIYITGCLAAYHICPSLTFFILSEIYFSLHSSLAPRSASLSPICTGNPARIRHFFPQLLGLIQENHRIIQAELAEINANRVWPLMRFHKPFTCVLCNRKLTLTEASEDFTSLALKTAFLHFQSKILTVWQELLRIFSWVPAHLSLPASPLLPAPLVSREFGWPAFLFWLLQALGLTHLYELQLLFFYFEADQLSVLEAGQPTSFCLASLSSHVALSLLLSC